MIKFYGVFQLVRVVKEDKTKKSNDTVVYFTCATNRGEDKTDFKFFKMIGFNADYMLRNLQKTDDGKYKSRKMFLEGYVETYMENQEVECLASLKKDKIPEQAGFLKADLKIKAKTIIQVPKDIYIVKHIEFVDKKKEMDVEVLINDEVEYMSYSSSDDDDEIVVNNSNYESNNTRKDSSKSERSVKTESKGIANGISDAFNALSNLTKLEDTI